jgi:hypothetical protein
MQAYEHVSQVPRTQLQVRAAASVLHIHATVALFYVCLTTCLSPDAHTLFAHTKTAATRHIGSRRRHNNRQTTIRTTNKKSNKQPTQHTVVRTQIHNANDASIAQQTAASQPDDDSQTSYAHARAFLQQLPYENEIPATPSRKRSKFSEREKMITVTFSAPRPSCSARISVTDSRREKLAEPEGWASSGYSANEYT